MRENKKNFLIFLLLLVVCCGKIAANYGVTVALFHVKHNKKGSVAASLILSIYWITLTQLNKSVCGNKPKR